MLSGDISFSSGGTSVAKSVQSISVWLFNPAAADSGTTKDDPTDRPRRSALGPVRCDSATPAEHLGATARPGCVMLDVAPTLDLDSNWGQSADPGARRVRALRSG
jgi:hypothetical protein